jgi:nucleoside phosphorylase
MIQTAIDNNFKSLFTVLMKTNFLKKKTPAFGPKPSAAKVKSLVTAGERFLPVPFRDGYAVPLLDHLSGVIAKVQGNAVDVEALTGCVYQHSNTPLRPWLDRFLAVISDLYRSFLDKSKRKNLNIELSEILPPLAVFQSDPTNGPFTLPVDAIANITGGSIGAVSMPYTFAEHPLLFGSLTHEVGGHDVTHADARLLPQLRDAVYSLFKGPNAAALGILWDYWMDEAAADVYGVLNMGPTFGYNLALLLSVFIGQFEGAKVPSLRTASDADASGLDVHPTDILRLALVQGVVDSQRDLSASTKSVYLDQLSRLAQALAPGATDIQLTGMAQVDNGKSFNFEQAFPLAMMQEAARTVGGMIATIPLAALDGHTIQDIETWDDSDENTAVTIAGRLHTNSSIVAAGDDAQIVAGLTLAAVQQPDQAHYKAYSALAAAALDDSFANDPYWSSTAHEVMIIKPLRTAKNREVDVDPVAAEIIDYNPLEEDAAATIGTTDAILSVHAITPIQWPEKDVTPQLDSSFTFRGSDAELPTADFVIFTWTSAEANAMSAVMTPGVWAMPASKWKGPSWHEYTNQWAAKFAGRSPHGPAAKDHYIGKYIPIVIGPRKVLLFKSNFHLARDDKSLPVKDMFKQVLQQTQPKLAITSGTAGAIGPKLQLGDVVIANTAVFDLMRSFTSAPFNGKSFTSGYEPRSEASLEIINKKLVEANAGHLKGLRKGTPTVYSFAVRNSLDEKMAIVTTDMFAYDDKSDHFHLQGKGAMVEMDDAVLGLAVKELGTDLPWLAIRNASDPQMPKYPAGDASDKYENYGYWTSIPSALAAWASVLDF